MHTNVKLYAFDGALLYAWDLDTVPVLYKGRPKMLKFTVVNEDYRLCSATIV